MKKYITSILVIVIMLAFCSCSGAQAEPETTSQTAFSQTKKDETTSQSSYKTGGIEKELLPVPDEYKTAVENSNPTVEVNYMHKDHTKSAVVYLPPDYDESKQYNILYILAGVSADHTAFFNEAGSPAVLKNIFDHMIINGDVQPFITVNLAFYPNKETTFYNSDVEYLLDDFNEELRDVVIPTIETKFSTYAESTSKKDLVKSRKHRAFSGFSLGGGVCWNTLANDIDYFHYFAPMAAGSLDAFRSSSNSVAKMLERNMNSLGYSNDDFFVFACEGTDDVTYKKMEKLIKQFRKKYSHIFTFTDTDVSQGNITYKLEQGASHRYMYAYLYLYNSLQTFWKQA